MTTPADIAKQWAQTRLAHEAVMLQDAAGVLAEQREANRVHRETMVGETQRTEEMGDIRIGDEVHYHQLSAASQQAATPAATSGLSNLAKAGIVAAAMAAGGLPAAGITWLVTQPPAAASTPATPESVSPETHPASIYELGLLPP